MNPGPLAYRGNLGRAGRLENNERALGYKSHARTAEKKGKEGISRNFAGFVEGVQTRIADGTKSCMIQIAWQPCRSYSQMAFVISFTGGSTGSKAKPNG